MRQWATVFVDAHKDDPIDSENALFRDHVAHLGPHRDRRPTKGRGKHAELDEVALTRRGQELNFRDEFGNSAGITDLDNRINSGFFIDPSQQAAAEKCSVSVEIFGLNRLIAFVSVDTV